MARDNKELDPSFDLYIPKKNPEYVANTTSNYRFLKEIITSGEFFPVYIYGDSGIGKTSSIEDICASLQRPFFRVQITQETIDEDLIGSMKLVNGNMVWNDGAILTAYRSGGVVVLDEVDLNPNLMILQPILEKKPFYVKQTGELVEPAPGFTIFATGNSRGDGSDVRYIGTQVLNQSFLERFGAIIKHEFNTIQTEKKIAQKYCEVHNIDMPESILDEIMKLVEAIRATYLNNGEGVYISTRRIQYILKAYKILGKISPAIKCVVSRFSDSERDAIMLMWKSIHIEKE